MLTVNKFSVWYETWRVSVVFVVFIGLSFQGGPCQPRTPHVSWWSCNADIFQHQKHLPIPPRFPVAAASEQDGRAVSEKLKHMWTYVAEADFMTTVSLYLDTVSARMGVGHLLLPAQLSGTHWVMICVIWRLALTVSDVCLKLGCFQSTSMHSASFRRITLYINSPLSDWLTDCQYLFFLYPVLSYLKVKN